MGVAGGIQSQSQNHNNLSLGGVSGMNNNNNSHNNLNLQNYKTVRSDTPVTTRTAPVHLSSQKSGTNIIRHSHQHSKSEAELMMPNPNTNIFKSMQSQQNMNHPSYFHQTQTQTQGLNLRTPATAAGTQIPLSQTASTSNISHHQLPSDRTGGVGGISGGGGLQSSSQFVTITPGGQTYTHNTNHTQLQKIGQRPNFQDWYLRDLREQSTNSNHFGAALGSGGGGGGMGDPLSDGGGSVSRKMHHTNRSTITPGGQAGDPRYIILTQPAHFNPSKISHSTNDDEDDDDDDDDDNDDEELVHPQHHQVNQQVYKSYFVSYIYFLNVFIFKI